VTIERFPYRPDFVFDSVGTIDWAALEHAVGHGGPADPEPTP
jgi:hypothetical protein